MIDLTKPYCKLIALLQQLKIDEELLKSIDILKDNEHFEEIKALYNLEEKKEKYKEDLINRYSSNYICEAEKNYVKNMMIAFEKNDKEFCDVTFELNPFAVFEKSPFIFVVQDGKKVIYKQRDTDYILLPKNLATGTLRIDDIVLAGGLKFLLSIRNYNKPFTIKDLLTGSDNLDVALLIDKIKKLLLLQSIIINEPI